MYDGALHIPRGDRMSPSARSKVIRRPKLKPQFMSRRCSVCGELYGASGYAPQERDALHPVCRTCWR